MPSLSPAKNHNSSDTKSQTRRTSDAPADDLKKTGLSDLEKMKKGGFWFRKWSLEDVAALCWIIVIHVLAALAPFVFTLNALAVSIVLLLFTGMGMTLGYHRLVTHRSFKIHKLIEYFFVYCGTLAAQKDPIAWVSSHKNHHKYAETDRDPHSPSEGFWFSHLGWFCYNDYVAAKCGESRNRKFANVPELKAQWFYRFLHDTYYLHPTAVAVLLYVYGGFPYLAWGLGMRTVMVCHLTFLVRSVGHIWGDRTWNTPDSSTNNWLTGTFTLGEGWHNNHHAFPSSARHGMEWWQFDLTWELIKFLKMVGLATDVKIPSEDDKKRMKIFLESKQTTNKVIVESLDNGSFDS